MRLRQFRMEPAIDEGETLPERMTRQELMRLELAFGGRRPLKTRRRRKFDDEPLHFGRSRR